MRGAHSFPSSYSNDPYIPEHSGIPGINTVRLNSFRTSAKERDIKNDEYDITRSKQQQQPALLGLAGEILPFTI